jgi:two-component system, NarL family, nitrate/nitrite response regulator NarL
VRLVLCDDHRLFIDALAAALTRHGLTVAALATSPEEALALVATHQPDICLLDARFPGSSGLDALRVISGRYPRVKVVMLSASSDPDVVSAAIDGGVAGFIRKDQRVADIVHVLARVWAGERVLDADLLRGVVRSLHRPVNPDGHWLLGFLTSREQEVLMLMMEGECTKQIARSLAIAQSTARTHVQNVLVKLGVHSQLEATTMVARTGVFGRPGRYSLGTSAQAAGGG